MDGIAIRFTSYEKGNRTFAIKAVQSAGEASVAIDSEDQCIEIMTGAALDSTVDTVIRYEDITVSNGIATINIDIRKVRISILKEKTKSSRDTG